mmetsp:Transcript_42730/g.110811  ORF Transcript_42730/g.110811 Transcript_42730/m.110811 type:complete len:202 (+) Transcript_42730:136-741(+)
MWANDAAYHTCGAAAGAGRRGAPAGGGAAAKPRRRRRIKELSVGGGHGHHDVGADAGPDSEEGAGAHSRLAGGRRHRGGGGERVHQSLVPHGLRLRGAVHRLLAAHLQVGLRLHRQAAGHHLLPGALGHRGRRQDAVGGGHPPGGRRCRRGARHAAERGAAAALRYGGGLCRVPRRPGRPACRQHACVARARGIPGLGKPL